MAKTFRLPKEEPLLNIASYARGGPRAADRLTPSQIEQIRLYGFRKLSIGCGLCQTGVPCESCRPLAAACAKVE